MNKKYIKRSFKEFFKYFLARVTRQFFKSFEIFPVVNNRILFHAYDSKHICCNPKAISEYLEENYAGLFEIVWVLNNNKPIISDNKNYILVKPRSLLFYYMKATAKLCVVNATNFPEIPLRKDQFQIQTYHGGGCYKTVGTSMVGENTYFINKKINWDNQNTSLVLSSSQYFTDEVIRKQLNYKGEILSVGMPRNDLLVRGNFEGYRDKVLSLFKLDKDVKVVLYAPTWRDSGNYNYEQINVDILLFTLKKKFGGKWVFMVRAHYLSKNNNCKDVLNVSDYPDMQELLGTADILISDYSSSIWDYSFTYRPCILFVPDLNDYIEDRGLDVAIDKWGFPICQNNNELIKTLLEWNQESFCQNMKNHHVALGSFEKGNATKSVCDRIYKECFNK